MAYLVLKEVGIDATVRVNSIGTPESRANYKNALVSYFRSRRAKLSEDDKRRLTRNPLRILDSKDPAVMELKPASNEIRRRAAAAMVVPKRRKTVRAVAKARRKSA